MTHGFYTCGEISVRKDIRGDEKRLLGLMHDLGRKSGLAFMGVDKYVERLGISSNTVRKILKKLQRLGFIRRESGGGGRSKCACYRLLALPPDRGRPKGARQKEPEKGSNSMEPFSTTKGSKIASGNPPASGGKPLRIGAPYKEENVLSTTGEEAMSAVAVMDQAPLPLARAHVGTATPTAEGIEAGCPQGTALDAVVRLFLAASTRHQDPAEARAQMADLVRGGLSLTDLGAWLDAVGTTGTALYARELAEPVRRFAEQRRREAAEATRPSAAGPAPEPTAPWLAAAVAYVRARGLAVLHSVDGSQVAEVLPDVGDDLERGLPVAVHAGGQMGPVIRRRLRTTEELSDFGLTPERVTTAGGAAAAPACPAKGETA